MRTCHHAIRGSVLVGMLLTAAVSYADGTIDVSKSTTIALPAASGAPVAFKTADGKEGWVVRLSGEAIPTPAYSKGRIFTGAGMGSRTFMAFDAATGKMLWKKPTTDNGPTSAIVSNGLISYNTESCDTESRDEDSGELSWHETTGGSLLTQPVVVGDLLVIPHPTMQRTAKMSDDSFRMLAVDLKTGKHSWDKNMTADVLGAPVASGHSIYFACTDGRLFCLQMGDAGFGWHVPANATSAPVVVGNTVAVTTEEKRTFGSAVVSIRRYSAEDGTLKDEKPLAATNVSQAVLAAGQRAEWDYQGPKIAAAGKHMFNAPGQTINSVDVETGKALWRSVLIGNGLTNAANELTPPALGKANLYVGSAKGHIVVLKQSDGSLVNAYNVSQPLASQPILAEGNIYFGTTSGLLVCLKLQDADAKDWNSWGGNAQHNKVD